MFGAGARRGNDVWSDGAAWNSSVEVFIGCARSVPRYRHIRNVPNCRLGNDKALVHLDRLGAGIALLKV